MKTTVMLRPLRWGLGVEPRYWKPCKSPYCSSTNAGQSVTSLPFCSMVPFVGATRRSPLELYYLISVASLLPQVIK